MSVSTAFRPMAANSQVGSASHHGWERGLHGGRGCASQSIHKAVICPPPPAKGRTVLRHKEYH
jgi:hypothetical protein